jgi:hypothetical protein
MLRENDARGSLESDSDAMIYSDRQDDVIASSISCLEVSSLHNVDDAEVSMVRWL